MGYTSLVPIRNSAIFGRSLNIGRNLNIECRDHSITSGAFRSGHPLCDFCHTMSQACILLINKTHSQQVNIVQDFVNLFAQLCGDVVWILGL